METPVVNFHSHVGSWAPTADDDPDRYLHIMDCAGIDISCINCIFHGDTRRGHDRVAWFVEQHPERYVGVAYANPHYPEETIAELERAFDQLSMKFLKVYPDYFHRPVDDPAYFFIFDWINERDLAVMTHATFPFDPPGTTIPGRFEALAVRFPRVKWVLAHEGANMREGSMEVARTIPNAYLETCASPNPLGAIKYAVESVGEDKILFGTDSPLHDARFELGKIVTADISETAKRKILGLNAIKLLDL